MVEDVGGGGLPGYAFARENAARLLDQATGQLRYPVVESAMPAAPSFDEMDGRPGLCVGADAQQGMVQISVEQLQAFTRLQEELAAAQAELSRRDRRVRRLLESAAGKLAVLEGQMEVVRIFGGLTGRPENNWGSLTSIDPGYEVREFLRDHPEFGLTPVDNDQADNSMMAAQQRGL